jgi:hypothetical protein
MSHDCLRGTEAAVAEGGLRTSTCGNSDLLARSYVFPAHWPFAALPLVMETAPGSCDLYRPERSINQSACCALSRRRDNDHLDQRVHGQYNAEDPEPHVLEAIASTLSGCHLRTCHTVDLGANNGWFAMYMLQLGVRHVTAVEPQADLARAVLESAELNCAAQRVTVVNAYACARFTETPSLVKLRASRFRSCMAPSRVDNSSCTVDGWRWGSSALRTQLAKKHGANCATKANLPEEIGGVPLAEILLSASRLSSTQQDRSRPVVYVGPEVSRRAAGLSWTDRWHSPKRWRFGASSSPYKPSSSSSSSSSSFSFFSFFHGGDPHAGQVPPPTPPVLIDLIKMDADGPEGGWLEEVDAMITAGALRVRSILVEASYVRPAVFQRMQNAHGFTFYRFDTVDPRRAMSRSGHDLYSRPGTLERIDRFDDEHKRLDAQFASRFSPHNLRRMQPYLTTPQERAAVPGQDGIPRTALEDELFGVRAIRHAFRAKPRLSLQAWTTLLQPITHEGYNSDPATWLMTLEGDLTTRTTMPHMSTVSPEHRAARKAGYVHGPPSPPTRAGSRVPAAHARRDRLARSSGRLRL